MSKNIIIQEGGTPFNFSADELRTAQVGGGNVLWVPKDETRLTTKTITKDGTYKAADEGYYGYSQVSVSGIGKAVGKAPDGSGDSAQATVDPSTGQIIVKKIPSAIDVTTPPTQLSYTDGELIDYSGIVVKAYLNSGEVFTDNSYPGGIIPVAQLVFPTSEADLSESQESAHSYITGNLPQPIPYAQSATFYGSRIDDQGWRHEDYFTASLIVRAFIVVLPNKWWGFCFASKDGNFTVTRDTVLSKPGFEDQHEHVEQNSIASSVEGYPVFYVRSAADHSIFNSEQDDIPKISNDSNYNENDVYTVIYGNTVYVQMLPVEWTSPYDGKTLTDEFAIYVS